MLIDSKVRVICRRVFKDASVQIIRGIVVEETDIYLKIEGKLYQQTISENTGRKVEKPVDKENKTIFVPFHSIRFGEIIEEGTESDILDREAKKEKPLSKTEIKEEEGIL